MDWCGHGRDALYSAHEGFTVQATDFSAVGLEQLRAAAARQGEVMREKAQADSTTAASARPSATRVRLGAVA